MDFALYGSNTAIDSTVCTAKSATGKKLGVFEGFRGLREAEGCLPKKAPLQVELSKPKDLTERLATLPRAIIARPQYLRQEIF